MTQKIQSDLLHSHLSSILSPPSPANTMFSLSGDKMPLGYRRKISYHTYTLSGLSTLSASVELYQLYYTIRTRILEPRAETSEIPSLG